MSSSGSKLKILVSSDFFPPSLGGVQTTTVNLINGLVELGHEVHVIAPGPSLFVSKTETNYGSTIHLVPSLPWPFVKGGRFGFGSRRIIRRIVTNVKPDIIHAQDVFPTSYATLLAARKLSIPAVVVAHSSPEVWLFTLRPRKRLYTIAKSLSLSWMVRRFNIASGFVSPTETITKGFLDNGVSIPSLSISNGVSLEVPPHRDPAKVRGLVELPDKLTLLSTGRVTPDKSIDDLVKGLAALRNQQKIDAQMIVMGEGAARPSLEKLAAKLGIAGDTHFVGRVNPESRKRDYIAASDIFVIASSIETESIVVLEAEAMSKPVVASSEGALPEIVKPGVNGGLFKFGHPEEMAEVIAGLWQDKDKLPALGQASRKLAEARDIRDMPKNYVDYYMRLVGDGK